MFCNVADVRVLRVSWSSAGNCARATWVAVRELVAVRGTAYGDVAERGELRVSRPPCVSRSTSERCTPAVVHELVAVRGTAHRKRRTSPCGVLFDKGCDYRDEIRFDQKRVQLGAV